MTLFAGEGGVEGYLQANGGAAPFCFVPSSSLVTIHLRSNTEWLSTCPRVDQDVILLFILSLCFQLGPPVYAYRQP